MSNDDSDRAEIQNARYVDATPMRIEPVVLDGEIVRLVPMQREHEDALVEAANFPEIWRWTATQSMLSREGVRAYMDTAFAEQDAGNAIPFVTIDRVTGEVIGSTRFAGISPADRRVEIGWTWLRPDRQRRGANSEAKCLMLQHAFDVWGALRIEIKTDVFNAKSRAAIERLGGTLDGVFRQHMVVAGGRVRDTAYYSILDLDWRDPAHRVHQNALKHGITPRVASTT